MMPSLSDQIESFISQPQYRPMRSRALAKALGVDGDGYAEFRSAIDALEESGAIRINSGLIRAVAKSDIRSGVFRGTSRGFGFVTPDGTDGDQDVLVREGFQLDALHGDRVRVHIDGKRRRDEKLSGHLVEVIERATSQFVGRLTNEYGRWMVVPNGTRKPGPIIIQDVDTNTSRPGDQVVVEIISFPSAGHSARGVIIETLGEAGEPGVDLLAIIRQFELPDEFSEEVTHEAGEAARHYDPDAAAVNRLDLRDEFLFTIDPPDARDFDDAVSIRRLDGAPLGRVADEEVEPAALRRKRSRDDEDGNDPPTSAEDAIWELGVHIADVTAFVRPGSALDKEARERSTSVYFPGHVLPMLPPSLSNGVCSLQEGEPRLCKSVFIQFDGAGRPVATRFAETVIQSKHRLTYDQAAAIIDGETGNQPTPLVDAVRGLEKLTRTIRRRRLADGMLVLDLPEVELKLDADRHVSDAVPADQHFSHTLIEMCMVEANEAVARHLRDNDVPYIRRVHPEPPPEGLARLVTFLNAAGFDVPRRIKRDDIQKVLDTIKGRGISFTVNMAILKSMSQAEYTAIGDGHFALASECYCHFTSPIRRYPDVQVHRALSRLIARDRIGGDQADVRRGRRKVKATTESAGDAPIEAISTTDLEILAEHCSVCERRAAEAEREYKRLKVLEVLMEHIGEAFDGVVTGVAPFGLFVQHPKYLIDGAIDVVDLADDHWSLDETRTRLIGRRSGRAYRLGDKMRVVIAGVELTSRRLLLAPERGGSPGSNGDKKRGGGKRGALRGKPKSKKGGGRRRRR